MLFNDRRNKQGSPDRIVGDVTQNPFSKGKFKPAGWRNRVSSFLTGQQTYAPKNAMIYMPNTPDYKVERYHARRGNYITTDKNTFNQFNKKAK